MASNFMLLSLLFFSSFSFTISQKNDNYLCLQKIMPCSGFLNAPNPPPTCCDPLKDAIANDVKCLCDLFNNKDLLKTFNVTQEDALKLPKKCGLSADLGKCKTDAGGKGTPTPTPTPPTPTPATPTPATPTPAAPSKTPSTGSTSSSSNGLKATIATSVFVAFGISSIVMSI